MHFNEMKTKSDWGYKWYIMSNNGNCYGQCYTYDDDKKTIFLSDLNVKDSYRNKGLGLKLQIYREKIGIELGYKYSILCVKKGSWMRKWYDRRGYKYYAKHEDDKQYVWLRKKL